jgi:hypothetical protein
MLRFRKQVELAFAHESNQLDSVMRHKKVPVRTTERVQTFFIMRDTFRLIERIIKHVRATRLPTDEKATNDAGRAIVTSGFIIIPENMKRVAFNQIQSKEVGF